MSAAHTPQARITKFMAQPEAVSRAWPQIGWGGTTTQRYFDVLQAGETDLALHESRYVGAVGWSELEIAK